MLILVQEMMKNVQHCTYTFKEPIDVTKPNKLGKLVLALQYIYVYGDNLLRHIGAKLRKNGEIQHVQERLIQSPYFLMFLAECNRKRSPEEEANKKRKRTSSSQAPSVDGSSTV